MSEPCGVIVAIVVGRYVLFETSFNLYVVVPQWFTDMQSTWIVSLKLVKRADGLGVPTSATIVPGAVAGGIS